MLNIKIAGPGCRNCHELERRVKSVLESLGCEATVSKLTEFQDIAGAGILTTPGLIVNGKIVSQGRVPDDAAIRAWLEAAAK